MVTSFADWLARAEGLVEVSELFDRQAYNGLFRRQFERLVSLRPVLRQQLEQALGLDWVGYIARSLRNAGIPDHDIDGLTHEVVIRLLVKPGNLFQGWDGQPILPRFKVAVRNAVLNIVEKRRSRQRWLPSVSIHGVPYGHIAARSTPGDESTIEDFRRLVQQRLGDLAVAVLDLRLSGGDTKWLVGSPNHGEPSAYRIKQTVKAIKALAKGFGDEDFRAMVAKAMAGEEATVRRRFGASVAT